MNFLLPIWNPFIVHPLEAGLRAIATPLTGFLPPGVAAAVAIVIFTIFLRLLLMPLSLVQIRSQRAQMSIQPEIKALQKKYKGDREGMARAQMALYKERGINPAAGCLPLLIQLPILFGMYSAMSQLATTGLTLDQVTAAQIQSGQVVYAAQRNQDPLPFNQFTLATMTLTPKTSDPFTVSVVADQSDVQLHGTSILHGTQDLTLTPGKSTSNPNPPNTASGAASIFLRPGGVDNADGTFNRDVPLEVGQPYILEVDVNANSTQADYAKVTLNYDPSAVDVSDLTTPPLQDLPFKSSFLWLPSLGQPDQIHLFGFGVPGLLLLIMTVSSFLSQRMTTMPTSDPQQQAMMRSMAFMPLMYLFFFLNTPSGLVLYWLTSNIYSMFQQYFTIGMGLLGGDLQRLFGRDFQPPWAQLKTAGAPLPAANLVNGRINGDEPADDDDGDASDSNTPAASQRVPPTSRRPRVGSAKGRRRGKR